jgi:hypothetical protein
MIALMVVLGVLHSSLDRSLIRGILERHTEAFRRCYEEALKREDPALEGRARFVFTVRDGAVTDVTVEFPMPAPLFTGCLRREALKVRFPGPHGELRLTWPLVFKKG